MTRIKQLRKAFGYTQEKLASLLSVSRSTVAMWETSSQMPDYETLKRLSLIFDIPPDFVICSGIFEKWDLIKTYYDAVVAALLAEIPPSLKMPSICGNRYVGAWLDTRLYFDPDELQLARWFAFSISDISITPVNPPPPKGRESEAAIVTFSFTSQFDALVTAEMHGSTERPDAYKIPVVGTVAAGLPCFAEDDILDYEEVTPEMAARGELFGLRVKGASMEPQIMDGDVVIVRRQDDAETGDTVVAKVNGDEATVKRLKKSPGLLTLVPANATYDPLFFTPEQVLALPVQIIGKVIELRRKF